MCTVFPRAAQTPVSIEDAEASPILLVICESTRAVNFRTAGHLRLARSCGFRTLIVSWRHLYTSATGVKLQGGVELLSQNRLQRIEPGASVVPAVILHRCLLRSRVERALERLVELHPAARLSYGVPWKFISRKWTGERCFRAGEGAGIKVSRPNTYLVRKSRLARELNAIGQSRPLIFKPSAGSRCNGILLSTPQSFLTVARRLQRSTWFSYVAQDLVVDPILYRGRKIDLRLYVLVTSFRPLRLTLYRQGVARIAARRFSESAVDDGLAALTGCSYRKRRHQAIENIPVTELLQQLEAEGYGVGSFWQDAEQLLRNAFECLGGHPALLRLPHLQRRFYLGGVDLLLTDAQGALKPLFIETNHVPQLNGWGREVDLALQPVHRAWLSDLRALLAEAS